MTYQPEEVLLYCPFRWCIENTHHRTNTASKTDSKYHPWFSSVNLCAEFKGTKDEHGLAAMIRNA